MFFMAIYLKIKTENSHWDLSNQQKKIEYLQELRLICIIFLSSFQIPRYILTLHELLAHTPHEHVERNSLDYAKSKLEELSR